VPHNEIGYPAAVFGAIGLLFTFGGLRSILADPVARTRVRSQIGLIVLLLAAFGVEIVAGVSSIAKPYGSVAIDVIGNVLAGSLLIGVARSWELVGDRDYGVTSSLLALAGRERHLGGSVAGPADVPPDDPAAPDRPGAQAGHGDTASPDVPASPAERPSPEDERPASGR
jgi:hypothetical protein